MSRRRKRKLTPAELRELGVDPDRVYRKIRPPAGSKRTVKLRRGNPPGRG